MDIPRIPTNSNQPSHLSSVTSASCPAATSLDGNLSMSALCNFLCQKKATTRTMSCGIPFVSVGSGCR